MPGRTLPTIPLSEIRSKNNEGCCYVTLGEKVYDVTTFIDEHPGGSEYILEYGGKDIEAILKNEESHSHSDSAYEMLDEMLIGFVATEQILNGATKSTIPGQIVPLPPTANGKSELRQINGRNSEGTAMSARQVYETTGVATEEDLSRDTNLSEDYRRHKFLDLNKPLFMQVWNGGFSKDFYLEQVHRPRHYRGGESAPLFGNFLEPLSKTPWWMVPTIWVPVVIFGTYLASQGLPAAQVAAYWVFGLGFWTIIEYCLHRFLFHIEFFLPNNRVAITAHFLLHGIHHYLPMDKYRLVMPPTLFLALATPFWKLAHALIFWNWYAAVAAYSGGMLGYVCYDLTHYFLHHRSLPPYWHRLKKYHLAHHFADFQNGFGVTSRFWDWVFGTELSMTPKPKLVKAT